MKLKSLPLRYRVLLFLMLALVTAIGLFYTVENWRGARAWAAVEARLKAAGAPMTMDELIPPMPPEDQNFAMIPIFRESLSFDPARGWVGVNTNSELHAFNSQISRSSHKIVNPWTTLQEVSIENLLRSHPPAYKDGEQSTTYRANEFLKGMEDWLELLAQVEAGTRRPYSMFPVRYRDGYGVLLPHLVSARTLVRAYSLQAVAHLELGNLDAAAANTLVALQVANLLRSELLVVSGSVHSQNLQTALQPLWLGLKSRQWSAEQLHRFQNELSRADLLKQLHQALHFERLAMIQFMDSSDRDQLAELFATNTRNPDDVVFGPFTARVAPAGWLLQNKAMAAETSLEYLAVMDLRRHTVSSRDAGRVGESIERRVESQPIYGAVTRLMTPTPSIFRVFGTGQTTVNLARIACALERYRLDHPTYPRTLKELRPNYLADVPHDIFNGEPLNYRREGERYVLWSVGWNESDDGGTAVLNKSGHQIETDQGDIVWRYPAPDTAEP